MSSLRIDNLSDDLITVLIDGEDYAVQEDEKLTIENIEKGVHTLIVHRTRTVRGVAEDSHPLKGEESEVYQLDGIFEINVSSGKCVATVRSKVTAQSKIGLDAVFSGYMVELSGGELKSTNENFSNIETRKRFSRNQLKEAFIPVGIGAVVFLVISIYGFYGILSGAPVKISDRTMTLPWTIGSAAVTIGCIVYIIYVIVKSKKIEKKYK